jgi:predicted ribonuclease YlaK
MLKRQKKVEFVSTSFIRGINTENCFLIVDEFQNMNFHELDSIISGLNKDLYNSKLESVKSNFEESKKYLVADNLIYNKLKSK